MELIIWIVGAMILVAVALLAGGRWISRQEPSALTKRIEEESRAARVDGHPRDWYPSAMTKKKRRAALRFWRETGQFPDAKQLRAMK